MPKVKASKSFQLDRGQDCQYDSLPNSLSLVFLSQSWGYLIPPKSGLALSQARSRGSEELA